MLEINQPTAPKKTFVLNRPLHLTKDGRIVEEDDPEGVKVLGGVGRAFYEEEAKKMGLNDSHRMGAAVAEAPVEVPDTAPLAEPEPVVEPVVEPMAEPVAEPEEPVAEARKRGRPKAE